MVDSNVSAAASAVSAMMSATTSPPQKNNHVTVADTVHTRYTAKCSDVTVVAYSLLLMLIV